MKLDPRNRSLSRAGSPRACALGLGRILVILIGVGLAGCRPMSHLLNAMLPADSRPAPIPFRSETLTREQFEATASELLRTYPASELAHIDRFRKAGLLAYEGPQTCLTCHRTAEVEDVRTGRPKRVDLMENLLSSAHYRFFSKRHPNVWGFNGKLADNLPMGKIDRPCPKPGSFAFTAWAELVVTQSGDTLSEGCGQCHVGGQYQAPLGEILPGYTTLPAERDAIDCLICHSRAYDMNAKQVVVDGNGRRRWGQDRSLRAALATGRPSSQACLRCHQHNFGGDIYIDPAGPDHMQSLIEKGHSRPRVSHPGSKRGTPFSPSWDVHAAAGVHCIDCHPTEGHLIARGTHTTTLMANDLPEVEVGCERCHTAAPHAASEETADALNAHSERIACTTCHIPDLQADNATRRDFGSPQFEEHAGIYVYTDSEKETRAPAGIHYRWWNGDATFLGNPVGDNPNQAGLYRFYAPENTWPEFADFDYASWYEKVMRPIANRKPSKLYAMKVFNGRQHIDLANMGPFGGMFVPYNLPAYYRTGDPDLAAATEIEKPMMGMMYGWMFKYYLLDRFMSYMDAKWTTDSYADLRAGKASEPRWIPMDASLEISHAVRRTGALGCSHCHSPDGVLDWEGLGYPADEAEIYRNLLAESDGLALAD